MKIYQLTGDFKYKFSSYTLVGEVDVLDYNGLNWSYEPVNEYCTDLRKSISGSIRVKEIPVIPNPCTVLLIEIDGWKGFLQIKKINEDKCVIELDTTPFDDYAKLVDNYEFIVDMYPLTRKTINARVLSTIDEIISDCTIDNPGEYQENNPLSPPNNWRFYQYCGTGGTCITNTGLTGRRHIYRKSIIPFLVEGYEKQQPGIFVKDFCSAEIVTKVFTTGRDWYDVLKAFCDEFGLTYYSAFLQAPINPVSGEDNTYLNYLKIGMKSDYIGTTTNPATDGKIKFKDFIEDFCEIFNCKFSVKNGILRIEHVSYYEKGKTYDNPVIVDVSALNTYNRVYNFIGKEFPQEERYEFMDLSTSYFNGHPIKYLSCVGTKYEDHKIANFTTDICFINDTDNGVNKKGFVLVGTDYEGTIINYEGLVNGLMSWPKLHTDFHRHGRYLINGEMNLFYTNFLSAKGIRTMTIDVILTNLDVQIKTHIGIGRIIKAEQNIRTKLMTITIEV